MEYRNDRLFFKNGSAYLLTLVLMFFTCLTLMAFQCISTSTTHRFFSQIFLMLLTFVLNVFWGKFGFYTSFITNFIMFLLYTYEYLVIKKPFSIELIALTLAVLLINFVNQMYIVKITNRIYAKKKAEAEKRLKTISKELEDESFNRTHLIVSHESKKTSVSNTFEEAKTPAIDSLTTLPSRIMITEKIDSLIQEDISGLHNSDKELTKMYVIYLALRSEELITHHIGHKSMDLYIQSMAHRIREAADPSDMVARISGAEFIVFTKRKMDTKLLTVYVEELKKAGMRAFSTGTESMPVSFSSGVSSYPEDGRLAGQLITSAEEAMAISAEEPTEAINALNLAKHETLYEELFSGKSKQDMIAFFEQALENHNIYMVYQPCFTKDMKLLGFETFIRLQIEGKEIAPRVFLAAAENCGYMRRIGNYSLMKSLEALAKINSIDPKLTMNINLSPVQLKDPTFTTMLANEISNSGCNIKNLTFDIHEESLHMSLSDIKSNIEKISNMGINIALDNFGHYYSSYNTVPLLPISTLRLDGNFTKNLKDDINARILTHSTISLMHDICIKVYATGIESMEQFEILKEYGCNAFQGEAVGKHMRSSQLEEFIRNQ